MKLFFWVGVLLAVPLCAGCRFAVDADVETPETTMFVIVGVTDERGPVKDALVIVQETGDSGVTGEDGLTRELRVRIGYRLAFVDIEYVDEHFIRRSVVDRKVPLSGMTTTKWLRVP